MSTKPIPPRAVDFVSTLNREKRATETNPYCYAHCSKCGISQLWGNSVFYRGFMDVRRSGLILWKQLRPTTGHRLAEGVFKIYCNDQLGKIWSVSRISPHNCEDTYAMLPSQLESNLSQDEIADFRAWVNSKREDEDFDTNHVMEIIRTKNHLFLRELLSAGAPFGLEHIQEAKDSPLCYNVLKEELVVRARALQEYADLAQQFCSV